MALLSILDPFISLMGLAINYIYKFLLLFGIDKVAICIIVFTIAFKIITLPLTYKQQKFTKVSAKMNPELQAISQKYKGKRDQESMMQMQAEQQAVYKKYGTSPTSGCLPMILLMVLLFALYPVVYQIPIHVKDIGKEYEKIVTAIENEKVTEDNADGVIPEKVTVGDKKYTLTDAVYAFYTANGVYVRKAPEYKVGKDTFEGEDYVKIMSGFSGDNWEAFFNGEELEKKSINKGSVEAWNAYAPYISEALSKGYTADGKTIVPSNVKDKIVNINTIFGVNIFDRPAVKSITILIPLLAALFQFAQTQISMAMNKPKGDDKKKKKRTGEPDPMDSMKTMNYIMPIFSGIICFTFPIGIGLYWITSSVASIILMFFIDLKLKDVDIQEYVDESNEKKKRELEKYGVNDSKSTISSYANTSTKGIEKSSGKSSGLDTQRNVSKDGKIPEGKRNLSSSSIAAIANIYSTDSDDEAGEEKSNTEE